MDTDCDGWMDAQDNCPNVSNANQADVDGDGLGDACDAEKNCVITATPSGLPPTFFNLYNCITGCTLPNGKIGCIYLYQPLKHQSCGKENDGDGVSEDFGDCNDNAGDILYECWAGNPIPPTCKGWTVKVQ
jgi:hypothetical protein